jgi:hypothetical protein
MTTSAQSPSVMTTKLPLEIVTDKSRYMMSIKRRKLTTSKATMVELAALIGLTDYLQVDLGMVL